MLTTFFASVSDVTRRFGMGTTSPDHSVFRRFEPFDRWTAAGFERGFYRCKSGAPGASALSAPSNVRNRR